MYVGFGGGGGNSGLFVRVNGHKRLLSGTSLIILLTKTVFKLNNNFYF